MAFARLIRHLPRLLAGLLLFTSPLGAAAQDEPTPCGSGQAMHRLLGGDYDTWWRGYRQQLATRGRALQAAARPQSSGVRLVVPVVVHVIHDGGVNNISDAQVRDAIRILNEDFQKRNADTFGIIPPFQSRIGNTNVEFRLAKLDPQGNCTNGITRTYSALTNSADDNVKQLVGWSGRNYLNVWVVNRISFGAAGYAYLPCWVGPDIDGIVILHTYFGAIGTSVPRNSRAFTHEVGHYLGLPHTWGGSNSPGPGMGNCNDDDGVFDTPNTEGSSPGSCNLRQPSCPGDPDPLSNAQNFMDYSYCSAQMFTAGQAQLMYDGLANSTFGSCHATLFSAANLQATGVGTGQVVPPCAPQVTLSPTTPLPPFSALRLCAGDSVQFRAEVDNLQPGDVVRYQWSFPGGVLATSTDPSPVVRYPAPGDWNVTLTASTAGGSDVDQRTNLVSVSDQPLLGTPMISSFDGIAGITEPAWSVEGSQAQTWNLTNSAGAQSPYSYMVDLRTNGEGSQHHLISPLVNVTQSLNTGWLRFRVAYAQRSSTSNDMLRVALSRDCGRTWVTRFTRVGAQLAGGNAPRSLPFVPTAANWRDFSMAVGRVLTGERLMFRFTVFGDNGNALFLDDVRLDGTVLGVADELSTGAALTISPNPSDGAATVQVALPAGLTGTLRLRDALGRALGTSLPVTGERTLNLTELAAKPAAGIYLLELVTPDGRRLTQRALVY